MKNWNKPEIYSVTLNSTEVLKTVKINVGDLLVFGDMALYTSCKNNTFNGMPLPNIYVLHEDNTFEQLTNFGYRDFK